MKAIVDCNHRKLLNRDDLESAAWALFGHNPRRLGDE